MKRRTLSLLLSVSLLATLVPVNAGELEEVLVEFEAAEESVEEPNAEETIMEETGMSEIIVTDMPDMQEEGNEGLFFELETEVDSAEETVEEVVEEYEADSLFGDASAEEAEKTEKLDEEKAEKLEAREITVSESDWVDVDGSFKLKRQTVLLAAEGTETLEAGEESELSDMDLPEDVKALWADEDLGGEQNSTLQASAEFYGASDGLLHVITTLGDGSVNEGDYYFSTDYFMYTNRVEVPAGTPNFSYAGDAVYYFADVNDLEDGETATPATSDLGKLQKDVWHYVDTVPAHFEYYEETFGRLCTMEEYIASHEDYNGMITYTDGNQYYLDEDGVPQTGVIKLEDGKEYYFDENSTIPGALKKNGWATGTNATRTWWKYFTADGSRKDFNGDSTYAAVKGLDPELDSTVTTTNYYALDKNGYIQKDRILSVKFTNGVVNRAYFDAQGRCIRNKPVRVGEDLYFAKSNHVLACDETVTYKDNVYYYGKNYKRVENKIVTIDGKQYYFAKNGKRMYTNRWGRVACDSNRFYYFGADQSIVKKTGWQHIVVDGKDQGWYYFTAKGKHYVDKLYTASSGNLYYFRANGSAAKGKQIVNGKAYYFKPSTDTKVYAYAMKGVIKNSGGVPTYYANPTTKVLEKGWKKIGSYYYHFGSDYVAERNKPMKKGTVMGWLDAQGRWKKAGWFTEVMPNQAVKQYYIDPETGVMLKNCWKTIDGLKYYFTADGSIHTKLDQLPGVKFNGYAVSVNLEKCLMTIYSSDWTTPVRVFKVSTGKDETPSLVGTYRLTCTGQQWTPLMGGVWGQWASNISGAYFIHSVQYTQYGNHYSLFTYGYNQLGTKQSHGCIRMRVSDAYWLYTHCNGSLIRCSSTERTPFGNPGRIALPAGYSWDPTDWNVKENHLSGPVW